MNFSLEELITANENGSLESLLLRYGMLPLDVLKSVLVEVQPKLEELEDIVDIMENLLVQTECDYYD